MNGLALDSGEFISADELNARWLPRKATDEEMSKGQPEALPVRLAKRLCDGISTGHDWPNTDDELLRMQSADELRRLHAENEALRAHIGQGEPVAWRWTNIKTERSGVYLEDPTIFGVRLDHPDYKWTPLYTHPAPQQKPLGWLYDWTHSSALGKPDEHFTSFTTDEEHARKHSNARPVFNAAHNIGEKK